MSKRRKSAAAGVVFCVVATAALPLHAQGFGAMKMPSTFCQYLGWGYGAGHHAPILRTPWLRTERTQRIVFLPRQCAPLASPPYVVQGCYGGHCGGIEPIFAAPDPVPVEPIPAPAPDAESMAAPSYRIATGYDVR
jgi:hypothetical protein